MSTAKGAQEGWLRWWGHLPSGEGSCTTIIRDTSHDGGNVNRCIPIRRYASGQAAVFEGVPKDTCLPAVWTPRVPSTFPTCETSQMGLLVATWELPRPSTFVSVAGKGLKAYEACHLFMGPLGRLIWIG